MKMENEFDERNDTSLRQLIDEIHFNFIHHNIYYDQHDDKKKDVLHDFPEIDEKKADNKNVKNASIDLSLVFHQNNKFITNITNFHTYDVGNEFDYYGYFYKDNELVLPIRAKYLTLKEELLNNDICWISINQWNDIYSKSKYLLNIIKKYYTKYFSAKKHCVQRIDKCDIRSGQLISLDNILSVILYTDFDNLCYQFRKTFRKFDDNGKKIADKIVQQKHSEFGNWARILKETIACFGHCCDYNKPSYHGLDKTFVFDKHIIRIFLPFSTSLYYNVAKNFSHNIGMIIEFNIDKTSSRDDSFQYGLSVEFFSKYKHEKEILFYSNTFCMDKYHIVWNSITSF